MLFVERFRWTWTRSMMVSIDERKRRLQGCRTVTLTTPPSMTSNARQLVDMKIRSVSLVYWTDVWNEKAQTSAAVPQLRGV